MNRDLQNFDYQPADKLDKLLWGRKDTFAPQFKHCGASAPVAPAVPTHICFKQSTFRNSLSNFLCVCFKSHTNRTVVIKKDSLRSMPCSPSLHAPM